MAPQTFDAAVEAARAAVAAMPNGDPGATLALWSRRDDVVLANPLGPPIVGYERVAAETARVASMFVEGAPPEFDEITRWESDDLGYLLTVEHTDARRAGSDQRLSIDLRVTTIFRREDDGWYLCLRHADRVTAPQPPTSPT